MHVIEYTILGNQESVTLELPFETSVRFHPVRVLAFVESHFTPVTDFYVMTGFHYVGNVVLGVNLFTVIQNVNFFL